MMVLHVQGDLRVPLNGALRADVEQLLCRGTRQIVLSMSSVTSIDAGGVGELVYLRNIAATFGAVLRIADVPPRVREMLERARLFELLSAESEWSWRRAV
jgi:anti-sigma B factor antagonist